VTLEENLGMIECCFAFVCYGFVFLGELVTFRILHFLRCTFLSQLVAIHKNRITNYDIYDMKRLNRLNLCTMNFKAPALLAFALNLVSVLRGEEQIFVVAEMISR